MHTQSACEPIHVRRIQPGDSKALLEFYNGLSERSKRTFRPLGERTTLDVCVRIASENGPGVVKKLDCVAIYDSRIIGWGFVHDVDSDAPFFGLGVADDWQGKGIGARLMDAALAAARSFGCVRITLTVVQDNTVAQAMYERRGFVRCGECIGDDGLAYFRMQAKLESNA